MYTCNAMIIKFKQASKDITITCLAKIVIHIYIITLSGHMIKYKCVINHQ